LNHTNQHEQEEKTTNHTNQHEQEEFYHEPAQLCTALSGVDELNQREAAVAAILRVAHNESY
jgi:hypothetical protein